MERQRGRWEARIESPAVRLEPVRQEAMVAAAWGLNSTTPINRTIRERILSPSQPQDAPREHERAWSYFRAIQFVHGWYRAFGWSRGEVAQLCRILAEPASEETERSASVLLFLRNHAGKIEREAGGATLLELAAFYGGLRHVFTKDPTHPHLFLLGLRMMLLQRGYIQTLFAPIELSWIDPGLAADPETSPPWDDRTGDLEERLGLWLDHLVRLLLHAGTRAEELWRRTQVVSSRSALQEAILTLAHRNGRVTAGDVLRETGANRNTVKDNLARLVRSGLLRRQGAKRGTVYLPV
ncbi:MAG: DUF977 family protein [Candidatus Eisenbacteria bacterium]|nr:DUF977 family protein [Candidatus Latescibacterota bacterium]MBD3302221.1 DUF977 family protein [Candidatus Eisenbacteria bacterium]